MSTTYHFTTEENAELILMQGLRPYSWLTNDPHYQDSMTRIQVDSEFYPKQTESCNMWQCITTRWIEPAKMRIIK